MTNPDKQNELGKEVINKISENPSLLLSIRGGISALLAACNMANPEQTRLAIIDCYQEAVGERDTSEYMTAALEALDINLKEKFGEKTDKNTFNASYKLAAAILTYAKFIYMTQHLLKNAPNNAEQLNVDAKEILENTNGFADTLSKTIGEYIQIVGLDNQEMIASLLKTLPEVILNLRSALMNILELERLNKPATAQRKEALSVLLDYDFDKAAMENSATFEVLRKLFEGDRESFERNKQAMEEILESLSDEDERLKDPQTLVDFLESVNKLEPELDIPIDIQLPEGWNEKK